MNNNLDSGNMNKDFDIENENDVLDPHRFEKMLEDIEAFYNDELTIDDLDPNLPHIDYDDDDGTRPNIIEGNFNNASLYELVVANQLLGYFRSAKEYVIEDRILEELHAIPKKLDSRTDNEAWADTEIKGRFLRFRVVFRLDREYSTAKLYIVERLDDNNNKNAKTVESLVAEFMEPTRLNFYNRAYTYFNISAEVDYLDIDKYVELKGKLALLEDRINNPWLFAMLMAGMKDPSRLELFNGHLATMLEELNMVEGFNALMGLDMLFSGNFFQMLGMSKLEALDGLLKPGYDFMEGVHEHGNGFGNHEHEFGNNERDLNSGREFVGNGNEYDINTQTDYNNDGVTDINDLNQEWEDSKGDLNGDGISDERDVEIYNERADRISKSIDNTQNSSSLNTDESNNVDKGYEEKVGSQNSINNPGYESRTVDDKTVQREKTEVVKNFEEHTIAR